MRRTLIWKEMRELAQVLGILIVLELILCLLFVRSSAGMTLPDRFLAGLFCCAAAALGASLLARDRRPGTLSLLLSLPIPRGRLLAAKLAAGLVGLLLVAAGGVATGWLAVLSGWIWEPGPDNLVPWWSALLAAALLAALLAVRVGLDWPEPLLPVVAGGAIGTLAFQLLWVDVAPVRSNLMALVAALCAIGAAAWRLRARFEAVEDRAPRWPRDLWSPHLASRRRAPVLLAVEWRQKRALLGILALLPLLHLVGIRAGWLEPFAVLGWLWLGGALVGASLFTARERDASRFLLHMLPIGRMRLAADRLVGGLAIGGLFLAECLLVLWAEDRAFSADDLPFAVLIFAFFYGSAFLIGSALSPWLRSTVVTALLALVSTYLVLLLVMLYRFSFDNVAELWTATGLVLAVLAAVAGWSTMRSRAFEPAPRKDLRVLLTVFAVWLAIAGFLYFA
jgi:hypothetical protein